MQTVYDSVREAGISLVVAASNDYSSNYGGAYGTNLSGNPDSATVGSPSTYAGALSVASINGQQAKYIRVNVAGNDKYLYYTEASDGQRKSEGFHCRVESQTPRTREQPDWRHQTRLRGRSRVRLVRQLYAQYRREGQDAVGPAAAETSRSRKRCALQN